MIEHLRTLANRPGVEHVMLLSDDGVPIAALGGASARAEEDSMQPQFGKDEALAAITAGWLCDLRLAVGPLSWEEPARIVMRCARGVVVMRRTRGAVLMVRLARGLSPEDVRLTMEGVVKRIERSLSGMGRGSGVSSGPATSDLGLAQPNTQPPGPIPTQDPMGQGEGLAESEDPGNRQDLAGM